MQRSADRASRRAKPCLRRERFRSSVDVNFDEERAAEGRFDRRRPGKTEISIESTLISPEYLIDLPPAVASTWLSVLSCGSSRLLLEPRETRTRSHAAASRCGQPEVPRCCCS